MQPARLFPLLALTLAGCGGSGGSSASYAGTYRGEAMDNFGNFGPVDLTVDSAGNLSGNLESANVFGTVNRQGMVTIPFGATYTGTFSPPDTFVDVTLTNTTNNETFYLAMVQNPSAQSTGSNPFTGEYAGSWSDNEVNHLQAGPVAMTINAYGRFAGKGLVKVNGTEVWGVISGTISRVGTTLAGTMEYDIAVNGTQVIHSTGSVFLQGTYLSGSLEINGTDAGIFGVSLVS